MAEHTVPLRWLYATAAFEAIEALGPSPGYALLKTTLDALPEVPYYHVGDAWVCYAAFTPIDNPLGEGAISIVWEDASLGETSAMASDEPLGPSPKSIPFAHLDADGFVVVSIGAALAVDPAAHYMTSISDAEDSYTAEGSVAIIGDDPDPPDPEPPTGTSCASALHDASDMFATPPLPVFDPPSPATSAPVDIAKGFDPAGGAYLRGEPGSTSIGFRLRVRFTDPIAAEALYYPPGQHQMSPGFALVVAHDDVVTPVELLTQGSTVHAVPGGSDADFITWTTGGGVPYWALSTTDLTPPAGTYDIEAWATWAPTEDVIVALGELSTPPEHAPITVVSWEWLCEEEPPVIPPRGVPATPKRLDCLGSGLYTVDIVRRRTLIDRGGPIGLDELGAELEVLSGGWGRKLSATSAADVTVGVNRECMGLLQRLDPAVAELELWRQVDSRNQLVWAGPVADVLDNRDGTATISASDQSRYVNDERRAIPRTWEGVDASTVFAQLIEDALEEDDPGISIEVLPTGILVTRIIAPTDCKQLGGELSELERTAVDWTITGRQWWVGGEQVSAAGVLPIRLTDDQFSAPPKVRRSRSEMATRVWVRGNGVVGSYGGPRSVDGVLIEKIVDENSIVDQASADAAARTLWDRINEPPVLVEGGSAKLDPMMELDIQTLIPGVGVPVEVGDALVYVGLMRLQDVDVSFGPGSESVSVSMQPVGTGTLR